MPLRRMRPQDSLPRRTSCARSAAWCADCPGCRWARPRLAIVAVTASLFAGFQANLAGERATVAEARRVAALALEEPDFDRALLLAVEAIQLWDDSETRVNLVRVISRAPRLTSIIRIPEDGVAAASMSLAEDGTRASVIDSDHDVRLFDLDDRSQLGEYSPFVEDGGDIGGRPRLRAPSRSARHPTPVPTPAATSGERERSISQTQGRSGVTTYEGLDRDGDRRRVLGRRIPVRSARGDTAAESSGERRPLARRRGEPDRPDTPGSGRDRSSDPPVRARSCSFSAVKFSPDGSRMYASGFGPTVVLDTASGEELHRIAGNGILAVSPDGRRIAVRDGSRAVRIVDSSGVAAPITVSLSSFPSVADFSPDSRQLAIAAGNGVVVASTDDRRDRGDTPRIMTAGSPRSSSDRPASW